MKNKGVLTPPVKITYSLFFPDLRVRDHWNYTKLATDALVEAGIIPDDRWTMNPHAEIKAALDKNNPRIEICVKEVEGDPMYLPI
jgi:Holliday junction resolvase RusA-like endonuclease